MPRTRPAPAGPPPRAQGSITGYRPPPTPTYLSRFHDIKLAVSTSSITHTHPGDSLPIYLHFSHSASIHTILSTSTVTLHPEVARRKKNHSHDPSAPGANAQQLSRNVALSFSSRSIPSRSALVCSSGRLAFATGPRLAPFVYSASPLMAPVPAVIGDVVLDTAPNADAPRTAESGRRHRVVRFDAVIPEDTPESVSFVEDAKRDSRIDVRMRLRALVEVQILQRTVVGLQPRLIRIIADNVVQVLPPCAPRTTFLLGTPGGSIQNAVPGARETQDENETSAAVQVLGHATGGEEIGAMPAAMSPAGWTVVAAPASTDAAAGTVEGTEVGATVTQDVDQPASTNTVQPFQHYGYEDRGRFSSSFPALGVFRSMSSRLQRVDTGGGAVGEDRGPQQSRLWRSSNGTNRGPASHSGAFSALSAGSGGEEDGFGRSAARASSLKPRKISRRYSQRRRAGVVSIPVRGGGIVSIEMLPQGQGVGKIGQPFEVKVRVVCHVPPRGKPGDVEESDLVNSGGSSNFSNLGSLFHGGSYEEIYVDPHDSGPEEGGFAALREEDEEGANEEHQEDLSRRFFRLSSTHPENRIHITASLEQHVCFAGRRPRCVRRVAAMGLASVPSTAGAVTELTVTLRPTRRAAFYPTMACGPLTISHKLTATARASFGAQRSAQSRVRLLPGDADGSAYAGQNPRPTPRWASSHERRLARADRGSVRAFAIPVCVSVPSGEHTVNGEDAPHATSRDGIEARPCSRGGNNGSGGRECLESTDPCCLSQKPIPSCSGEENAQLDHDHVNIQPEVSEGVGEICPICLDDEINSEIPGDGAMMVRLPACGHVGHVGCLDNWLSRRRVCPVCVADVTFPKTPGSFKSASDGGASCCAEHVYLAPVLRRMYC